MQEKADPNADQNWPAWHYGPKGEADVFDSAAEVPSGWHDHPSKHKAPAGKVAEEKRELNQGTAAGDPAAGTTKSTGAGGTGGVAPGDFDAIDEHGHHWDPAFHAATRTKTKDGLWRMKVGVARPAPKPGFPKGDEVREKVKARGAPQHDL